MIKNLQREDSYFNIYYMKKLSQEDFIEKVRQVHGDKYDLSRVNYINSTTKVSIGYDGEFYEITPKSLMKGIQIERTNPYLCIDNYYIIEINKTIHNNKYDLSRLSYKNAKTKIIIGYRGVFVEVIPSKFISKNFSHNSTVYKTDVFIEKLKKLYKNDNRYDYSKVEYYNNTTSVTIIYDDVEYVKTPANLLKGTKITNESIRVDLKNFIERSLNVHNCKYDYSLIENIDTKKDMVSIICPIHGQFDQMVVNHLDGHGCTKCGKIEMSKKSSITNEYFIEKSSKLHNNKYDYSLIVNINNTNDVVSIICPIHGEFDQRVSNHISGKGCKDCGYEKSFLDPEESLKIFIEKSTKLHKDKYSYDKSVYINSATPLKITCLLHGEFEQTPNSHTSGSGCTKCGYIKNGLNLRLSNDEFIQRCKDVHSERYDYSKTEYVNSRVKVDIICKTHGIFSQNAGFHMEGGGCPRCSDSKGEVRISKYLEDNNIEYIREYKFDDCVNKLKLPFDFFIPSLNLCIEYDGIQHFQPIEHFGGLEAFEYRKTNDEIKTKYCNDKNIKLVRISYKEINKIDSILNENIVI